MAPKRTGQPASLPVRWEELTASDFPTAVRRAKRVCVLPIGVIEKHAAHLPLATDIMAAREASVRAAEREYAVVFPYYYFGQVYETKHYPGGITIRPELLTELLQDVCDEMGRNGFEKILIVNGHGGNTHWLHYFCQMQLARPRDYVVYLTRRPIDEKAAQRIEARRKTDWGGHADEVETSRIMSIRPDLVKLARAGDEDGRPRGRLKGLEDVFTGIWWYADYPEHYAGDARPANPDLGEIAFQAWADGLVKLIRSVKRDRVSGKLQREFHARARRPLGPPRRRRASRDDQ